MNFTLPSICRGTKYNMYMQNLIPNTSAEPLPASSSHIALGLQGSHLAPVAVWHASHSSNLSPQNTFWLVGHSLGHYYGVEGVSQPSSCYLLLDNCWAQKNWNILKRKQGKKKSMWRNWIINSCSRNALLVASVRFPSSRAPGCELKGPIATSESVLAVLFFLFSKNIRQVSFRCLCDVIAHL